MLQRFQLIKRSLHILPNSINFRVGRIEQCNDHADADKLYVSQIRIGENENDKITVCSGLRGIIEKDQLINKRVILIKNMKPSKMRGILSESMVLGCDKDGKSELINPPLQSKIGANLVFKKLRNPESLDESSSLPEYSQIKNAKKFAKLIEGTSTDDKTFVSFEDYYLVDPEIVDETSDKKDFIAHSDTLTNASLR